MLSVRKKPEYPKRTTDHGQATGNLSHQRLRVECTLFCNLQNRAQTHAVLVISLFEFLGNSTILVYIYLPPIRMVVEFDVFLFNIDNAFVFLVNGRVSNNALVQSFT
jgi:hypothetical protein